MGSVICYSISFFVLCFAQVVIWSSFYNKKINFKNYVFYVSFITMFLFGIVNYFYIYVIFRMIFTMFLFCVCNYLIFKKDINQTVVSTIYGQSLMIFFDIVVSLLLMCIFKIDFTNIREGDIVTYIGNIFVSILLIFSCRLKFINKFYLKLVLLTKKIKSNYLFFISLFIIISINFILVSTFYEVGTVLVLVTNTILIFIYSFIVYRNIIEKNNSIMVKAENNSLMSSLEQYEEMVDHQRVNNHENKNQLLIIRNMLKKNDKDVLRYIDTIVKDQMEDDELLYTRVMTIPSGGLQGIIYQKMLVMKDELINFSLDVGRDVRNFDLSMLSMDNNYKLCKIIGVLLDNAIEESRKVKDKCIMISLFVDDGNLIIEVSNRFEGKIDIDKLDESGYTTKGNGHGYGLPLVKKILSESDVFENERCIKKDIFKQVIKVKNT